MNWLKCNIDYFNSFLFMCRTDDAFERKKKDVFKIKTTDIGPLRKLT